MRASFAIAVALVVLVGIVTVEALREVRESTNEEAFRHARAEAEAQGLWRESEREVSAARARLLSDDPAHRADAQAARERLLEHLSALQAGANDAEERQLVEGVERALGPRLQAADAVLEEGGGAPTIAALDAAQGELDRRVGELVRRERQLNRAAMDAAREASRQGTRIVLAVVVLATLVGAFLAAHFSRRLTEAYDAAQEAIRLREEFLSIASQELRRPLATLASDLEPIKRAAQRGGEGADELTRRRLNDAHRQLEHLDTLVGELVDVTRQRSGPLALEREPVDLVQVVRDVGRRIDRTLPPEGSALDLHLHGRAVGEWDRRRIEQMVEKLITNALRYGAGRLVRVTVTPGDPVRLEVRDHGTGFAADELASIFEPYEGASVRHRPGRLGVGLYLVREIVQAHGGALQVESIPGIGSTFVVELPLSEEGRPTAQRRTWDAARATRH